MDGHDDEDVSPAPHKSRGLSPSAMLDHGSGLRQEIELPPEMPSGPQLNENTSKEMPHVPDGSPRGDQSKLPNQIQVKSGPQSSNILSAGASPSSVDPSILLANGNGEVSPDERSWKRQPNPGAVMSPGGQRNVQFACGVHDESDQSKQSGDAGAMRSARDTAIETEDDDNDQVTRDRQGSSSFLTKLKALTAPNHARNPSSMTVHTGGSTPVAALSPQSEHDEPQYATGAEAVEIGTEADEEESSEGDNAGEARPSKRRKRKKPTMGGNETLPTTPRASRFASFMRDHPIPGTSSNRPAPPRRATFSDGSDRAGLSEDEGKDRIRAAWRRGIEGARGLGNPARKEREGDGSEPRRPGNLRRLTGFGAQDNGTSPFRQRAEKYNNTSAQKWRQVKAGLRMIGQRKKDERMKIDHQKSAQLMAELLAGAPAALIFASMFQRDEHHRQKVPVLLDQLKIAIPDVVSRTDKKGDRDYIFKIDLEYGNGPARMQWSIRRSVIDFVNLHVKYKGEVYRERVKHLGIDDKTKAKIPRFPKSVIPYARGMRGLFEKLQDEEDEPEAQDQVTATGTAAEATATDAGANSRSAKAHKRRTSSFAPPRRQSTVESNTSPDLDALTARQRQMYADRSRQKLEVYLQQMIRWLIFRPESTRLCKFLELSAMAIRLSAERGYQGKQGLLQIASRRQRGQMELHRKTLQQLHPSAIKDRHRPRWFLVRHSYLVCVDGPESLNPYDVFLVDSDFRIGKEKKRVREQTSAQDMAKTATANAAPTKKAHLIQLYNAERKLKLYARNEKQFLQFEDSLRQMLENTIWAQKQRFNSFAPVRNDVWARWLVDGRDYMWQVSRAIDNAKDFIYIHDWWLSPELYMRRPPAISQKWRLDRLLQRKAQEGVKIFIIIYRNIESAIPIDSEYTKWSLLDLHPNIIVQRSPNQFRQNQFFWAHHEKLIVIDNMMAFVGGIDLCFGRWDDPCHTLTDDKLTGFELDQNLPRDSEHCQMWPGKDYSNPRVQDFYALNKPYEEMYDRNKVPRMPWHDISMQLIGQPARDIGRHFVQRWNYVLRSRVTTRPTPVLMPPPEYDEEELDRLGMTGTCQIQILRSCSPWSIGTPNKVEHSIMNAYCALIRDSDHFVYIENQFFITSCVNDGTVIYNKIGDAIVDRAIKAHKEHENWQICIVLPLMPGFQNSVEAPDGTSVRLIMQCQYRSICRGDTSIFGRLRTAGIDPERYVRFYSLRKWGKIGPRKCLTTEQLYIHAKCMIVDDRSVIIGSANINERSMLGSRDSEVAALVSDTRMLSSYMGGKPYEVGEFPHTLRKRLMREHLGIDVDAIYRREQAASERTSREAEMDRIYNTNHYTPVQEYFETPPQTPQTGAVTKNVPNLEASSAGNAGRKEEINNLAGKVASVESAVPVRDPDKEMKTGPERDLDVQGLGFDNMKRLEAAGNSGFRDSFVNEHGLEVLAERDAPDTARIRILEEEMAQKAKENQTKETKLPIRPPWPVERLDTVRLGLPTRSQLPELPVLDDTDIGGPSLDRAGANERVPRITDPLTRSLVRPEITEDCMTDPLANGFYREIWHQVAEDNTKIFRGVFRCMPDSEVLDWKQYAQFNDYNERFMQSQGLGNSKPHPPKNVHTTSGPPGAGGATATEETPAGPIKSKGLFGSLVDKLRPTSRASQIGSVLTDDTNEKRAPSRHSPGSPGSGISSDPTIVPANDQTLLDGRDRTKDGSPSDEKEGPLQGNAAGEKEAAEGRDTPTDEKAAAQRDDNTVSRVRTVQISDNITLSPESAVNQASLQYTVSQKRRRRATTKSSARTALFDETLLGKDEAEDLLHLVQGHLVLFPYDWLEREERGSNWLYTVDQIAPLEIYD